MVFWHNIKGAVVDIKESYISYNSSVRGRHFLCYSLKAQLPLRLLCYDLSPLSARATGDLYTLQGSIQVNYVFKLTFKSCFTSFFIKRSTTTKKCNPLTLYHRLYFDLTCCGEHILL